MAEFSATLSALTQAAANFEKHTQSFQSETDATYNAAKVLSEGWTGDASDTFQNNMEQVHNWMNEMIAALQTFTDALKKTRTTYEEADIQAARNF